MELTIYNPTSDGFIKEIKWNNEEIKREVAEKVELYKGLVYTEDQIKDAKSDKAKLNAFINALEDKRKEIKKQCLAPYDAFEKQIKEIIAIVDEPIRLIDSQVKEYEAQQKAKKLDEIIAYFNEVNEYFWLDFELINNPKWMNATFSMAKVKAEIDERLKKISYDLQILDQLPDYCFEAVEVYKGCLDLLKATTEAQRMVEIAKAKAEAERKKFEEEFAKDMNPPVDENQIAFSDLKSFDDIVEVKNTKEEQQKEWIKFMANLTLDQAKELKDFFDSRNIEFERI